MENEADKRYTIKELREGNQRTVIVEGDVDYENAGDLGKRLSNIEGSYNLDVTGLNATTPVVAILIKIIREGRIKRVWYSTSEGNRTGENIRINNLEHTCLADYFIPVN